MPDDTKVVFSLWAVLAFLTLLFAITNGYLFKAQADVRDKQQRDNQEICERTSRVETSVAYIMRGIEEIKDGQSKMVQALNEHERSTRKARTN